MTRAATIRPLRDRDAPDHGKVGFIELFFDLVFVFAVTQLSHRLLEHFTAKNAFETGFLLLAVWTVWMWTTWATNWLDTRHPYVRLLLVGLMAAGMVMTVAIPDAFGSRAIYFVAGYVFMHLARARFLVMALRDGRANERRNFQRIEIWLVIGAALWIAGLFVEGDARWAVWAVALAVDLGAPWWRFWVPGMGVSTLEDWHVDPAHMAERCGLFVILALGESILVLGATFAGAEWTWVMKGAFWSGFAGAVAMWWIYFVTDAEPADFVFERHPEPGRIARAAYTYSHIPIVAGIVVAAVSDEFVLAHPLGHVTTPTLIATLAGPALFLAGSALFRRMTCGGYPRSHLVGLVLLGLCVPLSPHVAPITLGCLACGVLVVIGVWETVAPAKIRVKAKPKPGAEAAGAEETGVASHLK